MCMSCLHSQIEDREVPITPEMAECIHLIRALYELPGCGVGGPLHITTDDSNIEDSNLAFCRENLHNDSPPPPPYVIVVCSRILDLLDDMTMDQRAITVDCWHLNPGLVLHRAAAEYRHPGDEITARYDVERGALVRYRIPGQGTAGGDFISEEFWR